MTKNIYFKILRIYINEFNNGMYLQIKNIHDSQLKLKVNGLEIILDIDEIKDIDLIDDKKIEIENNIIDLSTYFDKPISGFHGNTVIESINGPIAIKDLKVDDLILDSNGNNLKVSNIYIFEINNKSNYKPILIKKSKCGIQLPYNNIVMTIKNNLIIKKIILKGRSLYLNGKAELFKFDNSLKIYGIETENKRDYLLSGFIVESI